MIIQKYRLNSKLMYICSFLYLIVQIYFSHCILGKNYLNILNWALFTFTSVTCTSYYLCAKKHNESIAIGVRNKN